MRDALNQAYEELKRVDHLIYVSLKYTRTADVLKNILDRMITSFDFVIDGVLAKAEQEGRIFEVPQAPALKCKELKELYAHEQTILECIDFYLLLRQLYRSEFTRVNEFRRHVAMIIQLPDREITLDIDTVTEYYKRCMQYMHYFRELLLKKE